MYCKASFIFKKALSRSILYSKCSQEHEKMFKEKELIEILRALGLTNNVEEYQKTYNSAGRKHKPRTQTEKNR